MSNDINHLDTKDEGLKGIFCDRFHDMTAGQPSEPRTNKPCKEANVAQKPTDGVKETNVAQKPTEGVKDSKWEPVKGITSLDKLKECVKWAAIFGGLNALLFYWQQAGLLDSKAAVPSMIICALLAGLSIGWNAR